MYYLRSPDGVFRCSRLADNLMNFALEGDGNIKIACFKQAEYDAETEAYIEDAPVFLGIIAAETLRKRAGLDALDRHGVFTDLHGFNARILTGTEAEQLPAVAAECKNGDQQYSCGQQCCDCFLMFFHSSYILLLPAEMAITGRIW